HLPAVAATSPFSLHDALPILSGGSPSPVVLATSRRRRVRDRVSTSNSDSGSTATLRPPACSAPAACPSSASAWPVWLACTTSHSDRKSTRLTSSHVKISYAVS